MSESREGLTRAILDTYARLTATFWPELDADLAERAARWPDRSEAQLRAELDECVAGLARPGSGTGVFWKLVPAADGTARHDPRLLYAGASANFLADAGVDRLDELVGRDDFDPRFAWGAEGARFVSDDRRVLKSRELVAYVARQVVDGVERWNRVAKAAIVAPDGTACGVLAIYQTLDPEEGRKAYWQQVTRDG